MLVNRLDQIYEQDLAIRLVLVAGNDQLNLDTAAVATGTNGPCGPAACYTTGSCRPATETLDRTNAVAGADPRRGELRPRARRDGRHGGGLAGLGVGRHAVQGRGVHGAPEPGRRRVRRRLRRARGRPSVRRRAHLQQLRTAGTTAPATRAVRVEPGSGSSIMAYAGVCGTDNLQPHSDPYFSQASIGQIAAQALTPEADQSPVQQVALNGFGAGDNFRIALRRRQVGADHRGRQLHPAGITAAIEGIAGWPDGARSSSARSRAAASPFLRRHRAPPRLEIVNVAGFAGGFAGVTAVTGPTRYGGAPQPREPHAGRRPQGRRRVHDPGPHPVRARRHRLRPRRRHAHLPVGAERRRRRRRREPAVQPRPGPTARCSGSSAPPRPAAAANAAGTATSRSFPDVDQVLADDTNAATARAAERRRVLLGAAAERRLGRLRRVAHAALPRHRARQPSRLRRHRLADVALTVAPGTGPFRLTSQAAAATAGVGAALPVTWDVAGTDGGFAPQVRISLSLDGGRTFTKVLAAATPNDGSEVVTVPRVTTTNGRIKVEGVGNVFYDASRGALSVDAGSPVSSTGPRRRTWAPRPSAPPARRSRSRSPATGPRRRPPARSRPAARTPAPSTSSPTAAARGRSPATASAPSRPGSCRAGRARSPRRSAWPATIRRRPRPSR